MPAIDVFTNLLKVNPIVGRFIAAGVLVLAAAAIVQGFGYSMDVLIRMSIYIIVFAFIITILANLKGIVIRILGWVFTLGFVLWSTAALAQIISNNAISWIAPAQCLIYPMSSGCSLAATNRALSPAIPASPGPGSDTAGLENQVDRVFIQFAGSINRSNVVAFAETLVGEGWPVKGADRGGERTISAIGLNEVRYFHQEDKDAAEALAETTSRISPAGHSLKVRDLSETSYSREDTEGLLEIWISN